jgi:sodium-dependent dicarboxylate transporter 2/3/5
MVGFIMLLSTYMVTADTGIGGAMAVLFMPFTKLNPIVFIVIVMVIGTILTNIANNMIVTVICMPFLIKFASLVGLNPVAMVALLFIISEFALATPAASPVTAVAMSQEMVTPGAMSKAAMKILPFLFVTFMIIGWPLALAIF